MSSGNSPPPSPGELVDAIADAARAAVRRLFAERPNEHFYYVTLVTTGEALRPHLSAWSTEALAATVARQASSAADRARLAWLLKWSYADSPYDCFGDELFEPVCALWERLGPLDINDGAAWNAGFDLRLGAMVAAMQRLDGEALFGVGEARHRIVVLVEVMPPDFTNTERAVALNPPEALPDWLAEAAEPEDADGP